MKSSAKKSPMITTLKNLKQVLGSPDMGERIERSRFPDLQTFGWECGCSAKRTLGDGPVEVFICRHHHAQNIRKRLREAR